MDAEVGSQRSLGLSKNDFSKLKSIVGPNSTKVFPKTDQSQKNVGMENQKPLKLDVINKNYIIESQIAKGGYGAVFKGHHKLDTDKKVAIKVFLPNHKLYYPLQEMLFMLMLKPYTGFSKLKAAYFQDGYTLMVKDSYLGHGLGGRNSLCHFHEEERPEIQPGVCAESAFTAQYTS